MTKSWNNLWQLFGAGLILWAAAGPVAAQDFESRHYPYRLTTVADGLAHPWGLAFLPNGDLLVTEREGRLRLVRDGTLDPAPVAGLPEIAAGGQGGLLDVALHPDFAENRLIYFSYAGAGKGGKGTEVARGRLEGNRLENLEVIFVAQPKSGGGRHFGSRLVFAPDGNLFVSLGERGDDERAQDLGDHAGSIVRITADGKVPPDNPFVGQANIRPEIYAYGVRNPQGMTLSPFSGELYEVEHGPKGGDEVNVLGPGVNYGWPVITYGRSYVGFKIGEGTEKAGMAQPVNYWVPSISPSGMAFYTGEDFPLWQGSLFVGGLSARALVRLELEGDGVTSEERLLEDMEERIRDVRMGPDGRLYLLTDESQGRILRLDPR